MAGPAPPDRHRAEKEVGISGRLWGIGMGTLRNGALICAVLLAASAAAFAHRNEPLAALIDRAESASSGERPGLYAEIAERELEEADRLYNAGQAQDALAAVHNVVTYSDKACDATEESRHKIKKTEIAIRKMAEHLHDLKRSLDFEDQQPVQAAVDHLEKLRTALLNRMFSKDH